MKPTSIREILQSVRDGTLSAREAEKVLKLDALSIVDEIAKLDTNRFVRRGVPEIVYAEGKSNAHLDAIVFRLIEEKEKGNVPTPIIISKVTKAQFRWFRSRFRKSRVRGSHKIQFFEDARIVAFVESDPSNRKKKSISHEGRVALLCAGTSDIIALNETEVVLRLMGCRIMRFNDIGVAFLKRLSEPLKAIQRFDPDVIVVAAGMEAALPSVVAGLSSVPVLGLPTSVGYGYGRNGEAALMSMLQACPLGISVVNIDGGVSAAVIGWLIAKRCSESRHDSGTLA